MVAQYLVRYSFTRRAQHIWAVPIFGMIRRREQIKREDSIAGPSHFTINELTLGLFFVRFVHKRDATLHSSAWVFLSQQSTSCEQKKSALFNNIPTCPFVRISFWGGKWPSSKGFQPNVVYYGVKSVREGYYFRCTPVDLDGREWEVPSRQSCYGISGGYSVPRYLPSEWCYTRNTVVHFFFVWYFVDEKDERKLDHLVHLIRMVEYGRDRNNKRASV